LVDRRGHRGIVQGRQVSAYDGLTADHIAEMMGSKDWQTRAQLRAACRRSLYLFTKVVVSYFEHPNLMAPDVFKESCDWLQWIVCDRKRGLYEDPRGHMKSTRSTIACPLWLAIQRPVAVHDRLGMLDHPNEVDRANAWLRKHPSIQGADGRYVIGSDSKDRASDFVGATMVHWESNPVLKWLYPELLWENPNNIEYGSWRRTEYTLNGRVNIGRVDPFLRSVGLESKEQGGRAEGEFIDDIIGETSYRSKNEVERRKAWCKTIGFLLENRDYRNPAGGFILLIGNRWSLDDVNSMVHDELGDWEVWRRGAFRCYVHGAGNCGRRKSDEETTCAPTVEPLWKERYPDADSLARVERDVGPEIFAAQFLNDPTKTAELDASKLFTFIIEPRTIAVRTDHRWIKNDDLAESFSTTEQSRKWSAVVANDNTDDEVIPLAALDQHVISIDPASSKEEGACRTAISWFAFDAPTSRVFWLDCQADRWAPDVAIEVAYRMYKDVVEKTGKRPRILVEKVAAQSYVSSALKMRAARDRATFPEPEMIPPRIGVAKEDRIRERVGHRLNQGLLGLRAGIQLPKTELRHFPTGTKDTLDTLVQAEEVYLPIFGHRNADVLRAARMRLRKLRLAAAGRTGVPL
jgi:hypothetical protein